MWWFFEKYIRPSTKNGSITVIRDFGNWYVSVQGTGQTTSYTHRMWIDAYKRLTAHIDRLQVQKVLMLGLGAGGEIKLLYKTFPNCTITVVEYDEEMVTLTHELGLYKPYDPPTIVLGDAADVVLTLTDTYDLIIVDLFNGPEPSLLSTQDSFVRALAKRVSPNGHIFFNVYKHPEYLETPKSLFAAHEEWMFLENNLGLFSKPRT